VRYEAFLAHRFFRSRKRTGFVSLITWISVGGVALGVAALIIALSITNGLHEELRDRILGTNAALILLRYDVNSFPVSDSLATALASVPGVEGVAPFVYGKGMVSGGGRTDGIIIKGVDISHERAVTTVAEHIEPPVESLDVEPGEQPLVVLGSDLAERLRVTVGDEVTLGSPFGGAGPLGMYPRLRKFKVAGVFKSGLFEYDSSLCFISRSEAQRFFQMGNEVTGVEMKLANPLAAQEAKQAVLRELGGYPYRINTWIDLNRNLFVYMKIEKFVLGLILLLIVLVAAFNIVGALVMVVMEKKRDIGILKSMGATDGEILRLFMTAGGEIGLLGIGVGVVLGIVSCAVLGNYHITIPNDVYFLDTVPIRLEATDVVTVTAVVFLICWLATLYPAWKAARLTPVDAIRDA